MTDEFNGNQGGGCRNHGTAGSLKHMGGNKGKEEGGGGEGAGW